LTVARVGQFAVIRHAKETAAVDRHVECTARRADVALRELLRDRGDRYANAAGAAGGALQRGRVDVGELGARRFGAYGIAVGYVVADDVEIACRGVQSAQALLERHAALLRRRVWSDPVDQRTPRTADAETAARPSSSSRTPSAAWVMP